MKQQQMSIYGTKLFEHFNTFGFKKNLKLNIMPLFIRRTDEMIQKTMRENFSDATVITVAHRLNTVIDSDRVLVMDAGVAIEFDAPYLLMQNNDGAFRNMVEALGQQEYNRLYARAKDSFEKRK
jgi:ABC-type multidrug transport system ATPase subunit